MNIKISKDISAHHKKIAIAKIQHWNWKDGGSIAIKVQNLDCGLHKKENAEVSGGQIYLENCRIAFA